jgi:hypothetical protein
MYGARGDDIPCNVRNSTAHIHQTGSFFTGEEFSQGAKEQRSFVLVIVLASLEASRSMIHGNLSHGPQKKHLLFSFAPCENSSLCTSL